LLFEQQKHAAAEAALRTAIALKPDHAIAHFNLGLALRGQRKPVEAEAAYHKAIDLQPDFPEAHFNLGNVLLDQRKFGGRRRPAARPST